MWYPVRENSIAQGQDLSVHGLYVVDEILALDTQADYRGELEGKVEPASRAECCVGQSFRC